MRVGDVQFEIAKCEIFHRVIFEAQFLTVWRMIDFEEFFCVVM
jgi:hypothetical protein